MTIVLTSVGGCCAGAAQNGTFSTLPLKQFNAFKTKGNKKGRWFFFCQGRTHSRACPQQPDGAVRKQSSEVC